MITENQRLRELRDGLAIKYSELEHSYEELKKITVNGLSVIQSDLLELLDTESFDGYDETEILKITDNIQTLKDEVRN